MGAEQKIPKIWEAVEQNKSDILLNSPSKSDQVFSPHYYHNLYGEVIDGKKFVFEHIFPNGYLITSSNLGTAKVIRTKIPNSTDYNSYEFSENGKIKINGTDIAGVISKTDNGWCKFANGLIVQWGEDFGTKVINFPISFTTIPQVITSGIVADSDPIYQTLSGGAKFGSSSFTLVSYGYTVLGTAGSGVANASYISTYAIANFAGRTKWIAIGY